MRKSGYTQWQEEWGGEWHLVPRTGPATIEFTKDGKIKTSDKVEGTYEVTGNVLKGTLEKKAITWKVSFHTDHKTLVLVEGNDGKDKYSMRWFQKK